MLHVTCDHCGKQLRAGKDDFVVKIEVFAAQDGRDHEEDSRKTTWKRSANCCGRWRTPTTPATSSRRRGTSATDLCPACRQRTLRNPLSRETAQKFDFSEN